MYSVVMMMAMSASPELPEFGGGFLGGRKGGGCCSSSCSGNGGCSGYGGGCSGYSSCSGYGRGCSGYSSCSGYGHGFGAYGSYSSCSGYGIYGAGCSGYHHYGTSWMPGYSYSPYGCSGSSCSGHGSSYYAPSGCLGSVPAGCAGSSAVPYGLNSTPLTDVNPALPNADRVLKAAPAQATVVVKLPADAKLFAQGQQTELTSAVREFVTPTLEAGQSYQYTFRAEFVRENKPVVVTRELVIKAGDRKTVEFADEPKMDRLSSIK